MTTAELVSAFQYVTIDKTNPDKVGGEYLIEGYGYKFHLFNSEGTLAMQILPGVKYLPPERCIEYVHYEKDGEVIIHAINEYLTGHQCRDLMSIVNELR